MRPLLALLLILPSLSFAQSRLGADDAAILQEGLAVTADAFVLPAYAAQEAAATNLRDQLDAYCTGDGDIAVVHTAFADVFLTWQRSSIVQVGPITEAEGPMRVQLWPDPKGFARRAVRTALAAEDPALVAPDGLDGRSIALTNLTALETLIYDPLPVQSYACDLATAIAAFQADLAAHLVAAWTPGSAFRGEYDTAISGNPRYPNVDTLVREFLAGAIVYVDRLRKFKLLRGLGEATGEARPERTEARRSGLGLPSIETSFRTLADFYETPFGLFDVAPDIGGSMEYYVLGETARSIADTIAIDPRPLDEIVAEDGTSASELRRFADLVLYQESFLKSGFSGSIGLTTGFTAADGD
ncbi:MAG: imelysin family protein [Pseudomonadota bacterium]